MGDITIYELNERTGRMAKTGRKPGKLPTPLTDATKAPDDFSNKINGVVSRIHEATAVLYKYARLLEEATRATMLTWPRSCPV